MTPLGIGLAGLGIHGMRYARHLLAGDVPGARLVACSRADEALGRRFADEHDLRFVAEPRELARLPGVDAVVAVLPGDLHAPLAEACVLEDRPILVEKPFASDVEAARALTELVERRAARLMVAQTLRFDAVIEALAAERERIGTLRLLSINQRFEPATRQWLDRPGPGGIGLNTAVHGLDLLRHLSGAEPTFVRAEMRAVHTRRTPDTVAALISLEPGDLLATLDNTRATRSRSGRVELIGDRGQVWGDHVHRTLVRVRSTGSERQAPVPPRPTLPVTLRAFVDALREENPMPVGARDGFAAVAMVAAAERSAREGRRVALTEVGYPATTNALR